MNTKRRHLVLNAQNQVMCPKSMGYASPDLQSDGSPSFLKLEGANAFAQWLAARSIGHTFYVFSSQAVAAGYTKPVENPPALVATDKTE